MDDNLQRVFSVLISILIFFILPLYITFEKIDDISYSLALKMTSNFVDNVTAKGYLTEEMYNDFVAELSITGNVYDVKMEHVSKKYNPVYYIYDDNGKIINKLDYAEYASKVEELENEIKINGNTYSKNNFKLSYNTSELKYSEKQILSSLQDESENNNRPYSKMTNESYIQLPKNDISLVPYMYANYKFETDDSGKTTAVVDSDNRIYTMNKGDEFSVRIKNENVTVASVLFNAFTLGIGGAENNIRVYINYGGTIQEEEYKNLDNIVE